MELYCQKIRETEEYSYFFNNQIAVSMCGVKKEDIVKVSISETSSDENFYWAYKDLNDGSFRFIFKTEIQVKMCSADFFKSKIQSGKGKIVKVKIQEI